MADDGVELFATPDDGVLVVLANSRNVLLGFVDHDELIPVKRNRDGRISPPRLSGLFTSTVPLPRSNRITD